MKILSFLVLLLIALLQSEDVSSTASIETTPHLMTTEIPKGITTPDVVKTEIGTLTSFDGVPDFETTQNVFDNLDLQRATQAFLQSIQITSLVSMKHGITKFGPPTSTVLLFESLLDSKALLLTANTVSVYMMMWLQLEEADDEPMVMETPANVLGLINDAWFQYVADFGNAGPDDGLGGKFLIVPPGFVGDLPTEGYNIVRTNTYGNWVLWRGFQKDGSTEDAISETKERFRVYPFSQQVSNEQSRIEADMNFVNVSGVPFNTIHRMDFGFWKELNEAIQAEPLDGLDPDLRGLISSIGIEKDKDFAPDERMTRILTEAANVGSVTARALAARPRDSRFYIYPGERQWTNPFIEGRYDFLLDGSRLLDSRTYFHYYATGISPAMTAKNIGKGSQYAITFIDKDGSVLHGSNTYRVTLPKDVPAQDFWSFTLYDSQTRSMLQTDQQFPGLSSVDATPPEANEDGSFDVYFGPVAPDGKEGNWLQTIQGKSFNIVFRLYGPLQTYYDKSWMPGDAELVETGLSVETPQPSSSSITWFLPLSGQFLRTTLSAAVVFTTILHFSFL